MKEPRETNRIGWVAALVLAVGLAVPVWAEEPMQDWTGGQTAAPAPVENQVPADFQSGVFDMSGNRLGANMEEVQAKEQARLEAFQAAHPDPGDGSGIRDTQGRFLGATLREAAAAGNIQLGEPLDAVDPLRLRERYGEDKVYVDEKGQAFVYGSQDGRVLTAEEAAAEAERLGIEFKEFNRKWLEGAVGAERKKSRNLGESYTIDDLRAEQAVSASIENQRQLERDVDQEIEKVKEETRKVVPLKTLRSLETGSQTR